MFAKIRAHSKASGSKVITLIANWINSPMLVQTCYNLTADEEEEGWKRTLLCLGWGLGPAGPRCLETVRDGSQACMQQGGKEREGGRASLGKSEGGGGNR